MSNNNNKKKDRPDVDPYDALGVAVGATDSEISKAYKKLALKLHPDKQKSDITESQRDEISKRFQQIQDARSFLLDVENQDARRKYDKIREGERLRKQADEIREKTMNINRKRMRDQLKEKEKVANKNKKSKKSSKSTTKDDELVDQLRKDGQKLRQAYAERDAQKEIERQQRQHRKSTKESLEERQIRLKWDRKKMKISPSEHSIATLFGEKFGPVEKVEFLGSKGNQALVTFMNSSSCRPCVDEYLTSKEMRAKFVGKRKEREEEEAAMQQKEEVSQKSFKSGDVNSYKRSSAADTESLHDRQLRQAAEREALLRQMEQEDDEELVHHNNNNNKREQQAINKSERTVSPKTTTTTTKPTSSKTKKEKNIQQKFVPFPLQFPEDDDEKDQNHQKRTPFEKLELYETKILGNILSKGELQQMQLTR